ncbi:cobaltochelatase, CobN subunit [Rubidibacter lacunae KORDI 51-2]|uniref:Cobaltochelatase, CobN subunit n=1 Tax=Rubidibacter lacunae KORDI 51-2 TaxID=582515 RepID=U5DJZ9_9CHRO|nr:cobaltochelatase subunit CobN [Rubidibacter lacunae]ERN41232.1 cobaltochelatase, CobN subunit [Rubidibacter lacunae KORDI 51-2]
MHRIAVAPVGWDPEADSLTLIEQSPARIVVLSAADTDIQMLAAAVASTTDTFPSVRVANLLQLQQQLAIDMYVEDVLTKASVIVLRLLGGQSYWSYGLEAVKSVAGETNAALFVLPGDDRTDPVLLGHSTVPVSAAHRLWHYLAEGGCKNGLRALQFVADLGLGTNFSPDPPHSIARVGIYPGSARCQGTPIAKVAILFYRAHYLSGNTEPIDALCSALVRKNLEPVPIFVSTLSEVEVQKEVKELLFSGLKNPQSTSPFVAPSLILNTTSFAISKLSAIKKSNFWQDLDLPVLQVILSGGTQEQWSKGWQGLSPRDIAMNVALPEVDGRVITRAVSFKSKLNWNSAIEANVVVYKPQTDRISFVSDLARNWVDLKLTHPRDRRIAIILANYPNRNGRLANGVGLDTPESCVTVLRSLGQAGYQVGNLPTTGDELILRLTSGVTNDPESFTSHSDPTQSLSLTEYFKYFDCLPVAAREAVCERWGKPSSSFPIPGIQLGNIFVGIQPSRGYDRDPSLNYHSPELEPTHEYLAFYHWLENSFGTQAIVHIGKHGNLEWLPGKGIALSAECYPEVALRAIPNFYPFIVNDPGEGSQAKRRSHAVILDHLTPPMTRAELYGSLQKLEVLIDEYHEAKSLDPTRLSFINKRIEELVREEDLHCDLGIDKFSEAEVSDFLTRADGYLCELKEAQIRDGLHVFGCCPEGRQLRDLTIAIARSPGPGRCGIARAIARDIGLEIDPLTVDFARSLLPSDSELLSRFTEHQCWIAGDAVEVIESLAVELVTGMRLPLGDLTTAELAWIRNCLIPDLQKTHREVDNLLHGLNGGYIPSGPAGAPTRGRPDVLPTGRNFYSVDIRAVPTETAWDMGRKAAEAVVERYTQEHGEYPRSLAISVWGTSTMRTGGDDIAEALALLGVQPVWDGPSRRVIDFEILPLSVLGRPRVDVTLRVSGFFRDGFPNLIDLFDRAANAVADLDEATDSNPLRARVCQEKDYWCRQGLDEASAAARSRYRVFGSKPGAYGAGLQGLIEAQNWQSDSDLARAYINWSSYAYTGNGIGKAAPEAFSERLQQLQIVLQNQDNREHDLFDSDDYYQFQGGLTAAVRKATGKNPQTYFGDHSRPGNPRVRHLREEVARVYRSRVVNPKWIAGVMRHGYKGAFELAATVDYMFAYDATARCVEDHMYQGVADAYLFDRNVQDFVRQKNPWALRDMAERLLEAHQRKLWKSASAAVCDRLRALANEAEGILEEMD